MDESGKPLRGIVGATLVIARSLIARHVLGARSGVWRIADPGRIMILLSCTPNIILQQSLSRSLYPLAKAVRVL